MQPDLNGAVIILEEEMHRWATPGEAGVFYLRPESLMEVAATAGSVEGVALNDGRIVFALAGRICRSYTVTVSLRSFLARLAHLVERVNYPDPNPKAGFRVSPYGFEAEVKYPLCEDQHVDLHIETCNGMPKIVQMRAYWFLIARSDLHEVGGLEQLWQSTNPSS